MREEIDIKRVGKRRERTGGKWLQLGEGGEKEGRAEKSVM